MSSKPTRRSGVAAGVKNGCGVEVLVAGNQIGVGVWSGVGVAGRGVAVCLSIEVPEQDARQNPRTQSSKEGKVMRIL
jgi:hypothetical protein